MSLAHIESDYAPDPAALGGPPLWHDVIDERFGCFLAHNL